MCQDFNIQIWQDALNLHDIYKFLILSAHMFTKITICLHNKIFISTITLLFKDEYEKFQMIRYIDDSIQHYVV